MPRIRLHQGDLRDLNSLVVLLREVRPDRIHHLAAQSYVDMSFIAPADTLNSNIIGTVNLLDAVRIVGINPRVHICSSSEVYGQVLPDEVPIKESTPLRPASPYAVSKVGEDMIAFQYGLSYELDLVRTRMFTHTGPRRGDVFAESSFAQQIAEIEAEPARPGPYGSAISTVCARSQMCGMRFAPTSFCSTNAPVVRSTTSAATRR